MSASPAGPARPLSRPFPRPLGLVAVLIAAVAAAGCLALCAVLMDGASALAADSPRSWEAALENAAAWQQRHPWTFGLGFFVLFTAMAAVPLPGCSVLALAAGAWWGWAGGAAIVTAASTAGATLAFLAARHAARDTVQRRWGHRLHHLEHLLERHGGLLVFWLRLAPVIPYPVLNPLLGLTRLSTARFFAASAAGMLAGSALYAWVGAELGVAAGWQDLLTPPVLAAVLALMALPLVMRAAMRRVVPALAGPPRSAPPAGAWADHPAAPSREPQP
jgi:uncharacterized membrane protein YdjX (TVP38/TMEM64 family)